MEHMELVVVGAGEAAAEHFVGCRMLESDYSLH